MRSGPGIGALRAGCAALRLSCVACLHRSKPLFVRTSLAFRKTLCIATLAVCGLLMQGCSAVKLAYHQAAHLTYWQLNRYLDLSDTQVERVRSELDGLHQWHRDTMLARHAELLQNVQQQLPSTISPGQACRIYGEARAQLDKVLAQAEPTVVWLASQLSEAQIRHLESEQADGNADWKKEWLDPSPDKRRERRFKELSSRLEDFYGPLAEPQKVVLRAVIAQSSFDPQRTYAERLRRQKDLAQVLRSISADRHNTAQARVLLLAFLARVTESPDPAYVRYAQTLTEESCEGFARLHNAMTPAQRLRAVQSLKGYERDFLTLAAR